MGWVATVLVLLCVVLPNTEAALAVDADAEAELVGLVNRERGRRGLRTLAVRSDVVSVARSWAAGMAGRQKLEHNPNLRSQMPSDWTRIGENVGMGWDVPSLHRAFMESSTHRANVLGDFVELGVGAERDEQGRLWVTLDFMTGRTRSGAAVAPAPCTVRDTVSSGSSSRGAGGYYLLGDDGGVFAFGAAPFLGSVPGLGLSTEAVAMALSPSHGGYWVLGRDGGVFAFGDAPFLGSVPGLGLVAAVTAVDIASPPTGHGYWVLGHDGGVFAFGDARFHGSLPGLGLRTRATRLLATSTGHGYWILGRDGGVFAFGDARFHGSLPGLGLRATTTDVTPAPSGNGYAVLGRDGGVFAFGDAPFLGSVPGLCVVETGVAMATTGDGAGYYVAGAGGRVYAFGDTAFLGDARSLGVRIRDMALSRR